MKLVELLARELSEWPEESAHASQDYDREIRFYNADEDQLSLFDFFVDDHADDACDAITFAGGGVRVTRAQWQAERDRQKGGEWKRHRGNSQPVDEGTWVEVKLRCGDIQQGLANAFLWRHADCDVAANIMKYRVISQPQAEEVEVNDTTIGTLSYKVEIDTTEASQAIDALAAKWDQMETPFKWRDEVAELNAYIEKYTRERDALIERLASEGFALIGKINANLDKIDAALDMSDWRNWKRGDVFENIGDCEYFTKGKQYTVNDLHDDCAPIKAIDDQGDTYPLMMDEVKFVRRP